MRTGIPARHLVEKLVRALGAVESLVPERLAVPDEDDLERGLFARGRSALGRRSTGRREGAERRQINRVSPRPLTLLVLLPLAPLMASGSGSFFLFHFMSDVTTITTAPYASSQALCRTCRVGETKEGEFWRGAGCERQSSLDDACRAGKCMKAAVAGLEHLLGVDEEGRHRAQEHRFHVRLHVDEGLFASDVIQI